MKKVLAVFALCSMATAAMAAVPAGFDILGGPVIEINKGDSVWIPISVTTAGDIQGVNLRAGVYTSLDKSPLDFEITDIDFLTGTVWTASDPQSGWENYGDAAQKTITTASLTRNVQPGQLIGLVQVKANGELGTVADFSTNYQVNWAPSDFAGAGTSPTQDTVSLRIVPEPAAALLLLAGLPLLRRRRA